MNEHPRKIRNKKKKKKKKKTGFFYSELEQTKSAVSDHVAKANHVIDWDEAKIIGREHDKKSYEVREAIEIRRRGVGHLLTQLCLRSTY